MIWTVTGVTEYEYIRGGPFWVSLPHAPGARPIILGISDRDDERSDHANRIPSETGLILNLEQGRSVPGWGRMIFYVADVDAFWEYLRGKGLQPESPRDASWGERYFHMPDPDGHELSFARPI